MVNNAWGGITEAQMVGRVLNKDVLLCPTPAIITKAGVIKLKLVTNSRIWVYK